MSAMIIPDVEKLLDEYVYFSNGKITVRRIDPYLDFELAREVSEEFKVALQENVLIIKVGEQHKVLNYRNLAEFSPGGPYGQSPPRVMAFKAEQVVTSTIQSLVEEEAAIVYFVTGHGEYDPESTNNDKLGLSVLASYVQRQNTEVRKLNLIAEGGIPEDTKLLVIAGPRTAFSPQELEMIRGYVQAGDNRTGRLMMFLNPELQTGLEGLLEDRGVVLRNDVAVTRVMIMGQVRLLAETIATQAADHPALAWLPNGQINMGLGPCRSLEIKALEQAGGPAALALLSTPESYWGETDLGSLDGEVELNEGVDFEGPLVVAALLDEGSVSGGQVSLKGDRIAVFGGAQFLTNQMLQGNQLDLFLNLMNWMLDKEESLGIAPKTPEEFSLTLTDNHRQILSGVIVLLIPACGLLAGFLIWMRRRK